MTLVFLLAGVFLLIPSYPYTVAFFYVTLGIFFMFMNGREQRDADFSAVLPVRKCDTVKAACLFSTLVELCALAIAVPFAFLGAQINPNGTNAAGLDANVALFAVGFLVFAAFNIVFLPSFYRTGYKVGVSFLKASLCVALVVVLDIALPHVPGLEWLDGTDTASCLRQLPLLGVCAAVYVIFTLLACRIAVRRYEKVDL
jgi:hypothetical protein